MNTILCPSSRCEEGAILLGVVDQNGQVNLAKEKFYVTNEFVQVAKQGTNPESRFRFAAECQNKNCQQWSNGECGVANLAIRLFKPTSEADNSPICSIKEQCRWFMQSGFEACAVCSHVITDV